jgi:hypothetical protein
MATSCPDFWVAAETHARPRGKGVIFIFSVLAEMRRTFITPNELPPFISIAEEGEKLGWNVFGERKKCTA